jgi:hypothetical protein
VEGTEVENRPERVPEMSKLMSVCIIEWKNAEIDLARPGPNWRIFEERDLAIEITFGM